MGLDNLKLLRQGLVAKIQKGEARGTDRTALVLLERRIEEIESGTGEELLTKSQRWTVEELERLAEQAVQKTAEQRINPNVLRAVGDVIWKCARQAQAELKNGAHNHIDLTAGALPVAEKAKNKNVSAFKSDYAGLTGVPTSEQKIELRKQCARHCERPGRTSCRYCYGEGFAAKSARENDPSRSVNKARHLGPETTGDGVSLLRRV